MMLLTRKANDDERKDFSEVKKHIRPDHRGLGQWSGLQAGD